MLYRALICASLLLAFGLGTSAASDSRADATAKLSRLEVHSPVRLTQVEHRALMAKLHSVGWHVSREQTLEFTQGIARELVREAYQDKGYFLAEVTSEVAVERGPTGTANVLAVNVTPGKRFRVTGISWHGASAFSDADLERLMPIRPGELFSRRKMAIGLEAAKNLYDSHGYINYTPIPQPHVDEEAGTLGWVIEVDEGGLFRFGDLHVEGMQEAHRKLLLSAWGKHVRGRPYRRQEANDFFNRFFKSPSPGIQPEDYVRFYIDAESHSVNYSLSLVPSVRYRVTKNLELQPVVHP